MCTVCIFKKNVCGVDFTFVFSSLYCNLRQSNYKLQHIQNGIRKNTIQNKSFRMHNTSQILLNSACHIGIGCALVFCFQGKSWGSIAWWCLLIFVWNIAFLLRKWATPVYARCSPSEANYMPSIGSHEPSEGKGGWERKKDVRLVWGHGVTIVSDWLSIYTASGGRKNDLTWDYCVWIIITIRFIYSPAEGAGKMPWIVPKNLAR